MCKAKILIVEDETLIALSLAKDLKRFGYEVSGRVTNFDDAIKSVQTNEPDLILMDINLGKNKKDGIDTAAEIKEIKDIPIIFVTAYSDRDTLLKIKQFKINPIAYLTKPYKKDELESQIFLAVYKIEEDDESLYQIPEDEHVIVDLGGGYFFDSTDNSLSYKELPISLSTKEKALLSLLIEARGNIVAQKDIEYLIWPDAPVSDSALRNVIYRLRGKLEHELIETIPSLGIKLNIKK